MIIAILALAVLTVLSVQATNREPDKVKSQHLGAMAITFATAIIVLAIILLATGRL